LIVDDQIRQSFKVGRAAELCLLVWLLVTVAVALMHVISGLNWLARTRIDLSSVMGCVISVDWQTRLPAA